MAQSPIFSRVKAQYAKTSLFNLGHEVKLTTKFGKLTPFLCKEILPGDTFRVNTEILTRLAPMVAPIMSNIKVFTHFFFVPNRLLWDGWEDFITQSVHGSSLGSYPTRLPIYNINRESAKKSLLPQYLGVSSHTAGFGSDGVSISKPCYVNALPFKAYERIWFDYYRDENLQLSDYLPISYDGQTTNFVDDSLPFLQRNFKKDYFTSALPFTQKGPDITLPIGGSAPVSGSFNGELEIYNPEVHFTRNSDDPRSVSGNVFMDGTTSVTGTLSLQQSTGSKNTLNDIHGDAFLNTSVSTLKADLSQATAVTINELRRANALQRWEELNARGGTRYVEQLATHFGVKPRDARLQRAQYLGGGVSDVVISEVLQTSATDSNSPQGNMSGHGLSASFNHSFKHYFDEHGFIIGIMSIMPKGEYMQGVDRVFLKRTPFDFGWPALAHLGEQAIYNEELYNDGVPDDVEGQSEVFGYTPRYAEYKFANDRVLGDFRTSLDNWHGARLFANQPKLNSDFISTSNYVPRYFATNDVDPFWVQMYIDIKATRKLPKFGTPML